MYGAKNASALYKAFGETRYTLGNLSTDYKFTGQREEASLGIYFFNARWYDGSLGRFLSPDTLVPTSTQGTQAWDRYVFVNNNPVRYTDPTGHMVTNDDGGTKYSYEQTQYDRIRIQNELCKGGNKMYCADQSDAHIYSVSGTLGFGSFFTTLGIDIVSNDNEVGAFFTYGPGPSSYGESTPGFGELNDYESTVVSPQLGGTIWGGSLYGESVGQDVENYSGYALQGGGSVGIFSAETFSSVDPQTGMVDLNIVGEVYGIGASVQPVGEVHVTYVKSEYIPWASNALTSLCRFLGSCDG
jgi:RHS repeat-associated protein